MAQNSMADQAYQALKEKILSLDSESYLSARQFAAELGISYTPVREAFLRLQHEGYLRHVPRVGFFVQKSNIDDLIQYSQVRKCIEPFALEQVLGNFTPDCIQEMYEALEEQKSALTEGNISKSLSADIKLHEVPLRLYGNRHLLTLYHTIREQNMFCSNHIVSTGLEESALQEHEEWIRAIEANDKKKALHLIQHHINTAEHNMKQGFIKIIT